MGHGRWIQGGGDFSPKDETSTSCAVRCGPTRASVGHHRLLVTTSRFGSCLFYDPMLRRRSQSVIMIRCCCISRVHKHMANRFTPDGVAKQNNEDGLAKSVHVPFLFLISYFILFYLHFLYSHLSILYFSIRNFLFFFAPRVTFTAGQSPPRTQKGEAECMYGERSASV